MQVENHFGKIKTVREAMTYVKDGITIMISGFGGIGSSCTLINEMIDKNVKDLTLISIDAGDPDVGPDHMIQNLQVKKLITSHIGATPTTGKLMNEEKLEVEFCPQGTLSERIRAGGAGLGGILTDVGMGTLVEEGKPQLEIGGTTYLVEAALQADVAIIYAKKADAFGNLIYDKTARGLNPLMAMAADITIVDAEEIVPIGAIDPEDVVTPGAFVDIIVHGGGKWKWGWQ